MPGCFGALARRREDVSFEGDLSGLKFTPDQRVDLHDLGALRVASVERAGEPARLARCPRSGAALLLKGEVHGVDAAGLLAAVLAGGRERAVGLPGHYAAILWEPRLERLSIMNDALGLYPLFTASSPGAFLFGTASWLFERARGFRRRTDPYGVIDLLRCEHMLDDHTLVEGVRLMKPGSLVEVSCGGAPKTHQVVDPFRDRGPAPRSLDEAAEALGAAYDVAFRRIAGAADPIVVPLTGGKDSRTVLAELLRASPALRGRLETFTLGGPDEWDARIAPRVAALAGVPWQLVPYDAGVADRWLDPFVRLVDGGASIYLTWWAQVLEHLGPAPVSIASGFIGDVLSGASFEDFHPAFKSAGAPVIVDPGVENLIGILARRNFSREQLARTLRPDFAEGRLDAPEWSLRRTYFGAPELPRHTRMIRTDVLNRQRRFIGTQLHIYRQRHRPLAPFADPDVVRALLSFGEAEARGQRGYQEAFARRHPAAARIIEGTGKRPYSGGIVAHLRARAEVAAVELADRLRARRGGARPRRDFFAFPHDHYKASLLADLEPLGAFFDPGKLRAEVEAQPATARRLRLLVTLRAWLAAGARVPAARSMAA